MSNIIEDVKQITAGKEKFLEFVHGDDTKEISTESGTWPSIAKAIKDNVITPNEQTLANRTAAEAAASAAAQDEQIVTLAKVAVTTKAQEVADNTSTVNQKAGEVSTAKTSVDESLVIVNTKHAEVVQVGLDIADSKAVIAQIGIDAEAAKTTAELLITTANSAVSVSTASKTVAISHADRAVAAQQSITDELAQVQSLADQVAADKVQVTSTSIGDEDYTIPTVTKLLSQSNIVATAMSDDVWAEHSYKWGGPSKILAVATASSVTLYDMTKPSFPVFKAIAGFLKVTAIKVIGQSILAAQSGIDSTNRGLWAFDFALDKSYHFTNFVGSSNQGFNDGISIVLPVQNKGGGVVLVSNEINSISTRIADNAPHHPVSGIPMLTIAVGTDGGVSVLIPDDDGTYRVNNFPYSYGSIQSVSFVKNGQLIATRNYLGITWSIDINNPIPLDSSYVFRNDKALREIGIGAQDGLMRTTGSLFSGSNGVLGALKQNPSDNDKSMVAHITKDYSTPFMVGDTHCALMCDGEEGVVSGSPIVLPTEFGAVASVEVIGNVITHTSNSWGYGYKDVATEAGKAYIFTTNVTISDTSKTYNARAYANGKTLSIVTELASNQEAVVPFIAVSSSTRIYVQLHGSADINVGTTVTVDKFELAEALPDRSGNNNHARINGSLTFTKPAGSDIALASGFSASNAINVELSDSKNLFPHDSDWSFSFTSNSSGDFTIGQRGPDAAWNTISRAGVQFFVSGSEGSKSLNVKRYSESSAKGTIFTKWDESTSNKAVTLSKQGSKVYLHINGQNIAETLVGWDTVNTEPFDNLRISNAQTNAEFSQVVYSKTALSGDQIRDLHRDMLNKLSKPSMLTADVAALAHDAERNQDWVATADHKLHRLDGTCFVETLNIDSSVGDITSLTIDDGEIIVGGSLDVSVNLKAKNLRETKVIREPKLINMFLGEGDSVITDFYLERGFKAEIVKVDGIEKQKGENKTWTLQFDGYKYFIRFKTAPGAFPISCLVKEVK